MHNSKLKHMHMLRCTNMGCKIIYVSMGLCLCPMQEMGMNFEHHGSPANVEVLAFVIIVNTKPVWNSWTLACYHGMASTCWGKKYCPIWGRLWYKLLTRSLMVPLGKRDTFVDKTIFVASSSFHFFPGVNIKQQECRVNIWIFLGIVWTFLYVNWIF